MFRFFTVPNIATTLRCFRAPILCALLWIIALTAAGQSGEVIRTYIFDERWNPIHAALFVAVFIYAAAVFGRLGAASLLRFESAHVIRLCPQHTVILLLALSPVILFGLGIILAAWSTRDIGLLAYGSRVGIAFGLALIGIPFGYAFWFAPRTTRDDALLQRLLAANAARAFDAVALLWPLLFLGLPAICLSTGRAYIFVAVAQAIGALPLILASFSLVAYGIHRFRSHSWTAHQTQWL